MHRQPGLRCPCYTTVDRSAGRSTCPPQKRKEKGDPRNEKLLNSPHLVRKGHLPFFELVQLLHPVVQQRRVLLPVSPPLEAAPLLQPRAARLGLFQLCDFSSHLSQRTTAARQQRGSKAVMPGGKIRAGLCFPCFAFPPLPVAASPFFLGSTRCARCVEQSPVAESYMYVCRGDNIANVPCTAQKSALVTACLTPQRSRRDGIKVRGKMILVLHSKKPPPPPQSRNKKAHVMSQNVRTNDAPKSGDTTPAPAPARNRT